MKIKLAGDRVRCVRESLGMSVSQISLILAVHPGTVHRWEGAGPELIPIDGIAAGVLSALDQKVNDKHLSAEFNPEKVGRQVIQTLVVSGALVALALLLSELAGRSTG